MFDPAFLKTLIKSYLFKPVSV